MVKERKIWTVVWLQLIVVTGKKGVSICSLPSDSRPFSWCQITFWAVTHSSRCNFLSHYETMKKWTTKIWLHSLLLSEKVTVDSQRCLFQTVVNSLSLMKMREWGRLDLLHPNQYGRVVQLVKEVSLPWLYMIMARESTADDSALWIQSHWAFEKSWTGGLLCPKHRCLCRELCSPEMTIQVQNLERRLSWNIAFHWQRDNTVPTGLNSVNSEWRGLTRVSLCKQNSGFRDQVGIYSQPVVRERTLGNWFAVIMDSWFSEKVSTEPMMRGSANEEPVIAHLCTMQFVRDVYEVGMLVLW